MNDLQLVECPPKKLDDYKELVPEVVARVRELAEPLKGLRVVHINATAVGGGVAEMLRSDVSLQQDIGLDAKWYVIPPDDQFFEVTKNIHNLMQGKEGALTPEQEKIYIDYNNKLAGLLAEVKTDILVIHDPQPAAAITFMNGSKPKFTIWRSHIDTSTPNTTTWDFLQPFMLSYDQFVFTLPEYANHNLPKDKLNIITPVIDPLSEKNIAMPKEEAKEYIKQFGIDPQKPLITQVSRLDPWKDPIGVIEAYKLAKKDVPDLQLALVAQMASDDPEGEVIKKQVEDYLQGEEGVFLLVNLPDNDRAVNAFQVASDIVLQKSLKEGFGLTITEAMYKGAVMIGGNVGGIKIQIENGVNGFLVDSMAETAQRIVELLGNPQLREKISKAAIQSVKERYLLPHMLVKQLEVFSKIKNAKKDNTVQTQAFERPQLV